MSSPEKAAAAVAYEQRALEAADAAIEAARGKATKAADALDAAHNAVEQAKADREVVAARLEAARAAADGINVTAAAGAASIGVES